MSFLQGFKNEKDKEESGGQKSFHDKSDHKGYHSKYDHFDSFHESTAGGNKESNSHAVRCFLTKLNIKKRIIRILPVGYNKLFDGCYKAAGEGGWFVIFRIF